MTQINLQEDKYTFYFKMVYTDKFCYYKFHKDITITNFIKLVNFQSYGTFNIVGDFEFEVIEAGHPNNSGGVDAEMAPKLNNSDTTLREIYNNNWKTTSFYLRCIPLTSIYIEEESSW